MTIQDILRLYPDINKQAFKLQQDNEIALKAKLNNDGCVKCSIITDAPRVTDNSDPTYQNTENLIDNLEKISLELNNMAEYALAEIQRLNDIKKQIDNAWLYLTTDERRIAELRYWVYPEPRYTWSKVVSESYYSERECYYLHKSALEKLENMVMIAVNCSRAV